MQQNWPSAFISAPIELTPQGVRFTQGGGDLAAQASRDLITVLPHYGMLRIEGVDAAKFLQGQLSCDVTEVDMSAGRRGVHCTPKGRAIASFILLQTGEQRYACLLPADNLARLQQSLGKYIVFSKATLEDESAQWAVFGLSGDASTKLIQEYFSNCPNQPLQQIKAADGICVRLEGAQPRYVVCLPRGDAAIFWQQACTALQPADSASWELLDIRQGIANLVAGTSEEFIPQMLNYDKLDAISFSKGCYTGQEVVARAHYRGAVKRRMVGFVAQAAACPLPGSSVLSGEANGGTVVSAVCSEDSTTEGLAVLSGDGEDRSFNLPDSDQPLVITALEYPGKPA